MSDFFSLVENRESCRNFDGRPVEREKLEKIIECVRLAPSACNSQPWKFYVVNGEKCQGVRDGVQYMSFNKFTDDATAFIVICEEQATLKERLLKIMDSQHFAQIDIGIATTHICYAAQELGLSTCILGWMEEKTIKENLGLDEKSKIRLVIAVGYAKDDSLREKKRKPIEEIVKYVD